MRVDSSRRFLSRAFAFLLMAASGLAAVKLGAAGATWYVDDATCPAAGSGTLNNPFCRIQDAICIAASSDMVSVAPGTYPESLRMKPGVSVVSQSGAAVTTINGFGKPCTTSNYCTKATVNQCSVVIFSVGHTQSTRLEGFTITGGQGLLQSPPDHSAGGGIFVFSSPTIVNNVITNNVLAGPRQMYNGAGIYIATGSPVISNNTISGNRAVPPPGTNQNTSYGYGGGISTAFLSFPIITNNIITGNRASDPNVLYAVGAGGGIVSFPGDANRPGMVFDRNLVADNVADSFGGGVALMSQVGTAARAVVTNNVIVGNTSHNTGGGVYAYFIKTDVHNNTITDNLAFRGGGLFSGQNEPPLTVSITNNVIDGNRLMLFGDGGGIYTYDFSSTFDPQIRFNDLFGNQKNQVSGDTTDTEVIGMSGNFSADPMFVNRAARDFHLAPGSPAIDRGLASAGPPVDRDSSPRPREGNGTPNNPQPGDMDVGAYEAASPCTPASEVCDGLDNNCNGLADDGFANTDGDGLADCVDPDDDNDQALDGADCAPLDASSYGTPVEVSDVEVTGVSPTTVSFTPQSLGSSTRYEVLSGLLSRLSGLAGYGEDFCATSTQAVSPWVDGRTVPGATDGWYYLVRSYNGCGRGTLGSAQADAPGSGDVCLLGVVDGDEDGSPSDVDCADGDALRSPLRTEVCDGLDNDCSGTPDDNVPDTDLDGQNDCADADDDGDLVADGSDCAPLEAGSHSVPVEVQGLEVTGTGPTQLSWQAQALGPATQYVVAGGTLTVPGTVSFASGSCVATVTGTGAADARPQPAPGTALYYLVKSRNACGQGTYGTPERNSLPACP